MGYRVLIVDDDPDIRHLIRLRLQHDGHVVEEADAGPAGLSMALDGAYDLAFIDIGLPVLDGYEIARQVRAAPVKHHPCMVAVTANSDDPRVAFEAGFDCHVFKPLAPNAITAVLEEMPRRKRG